MRMTAASEGAWSVGASFAGWAGFGAAMAAAKMTKPRQTICLIVNRVTSATSSHIGPGHSSDRALMLRYDGPKRRAMPRRQKQGPLREAPQQGARPRRLVAGGAAVAGGGTRAAHDDRRVADRDEGVLGPRR